MVQELAREELGRYASPSHFFLRVRALLHIHRARLFLLARKNLLRKALDYLLAPRSAVRHARALTIYDHRTMDTDGARRARSTRASIATTRAARRRPQSYSKWDSFLFSRRRRPAARWIARARIHPSADPAAPASPRPASLLLLRRARPTLTHMTPPAPCVRCPAIFRPLAIVASQSLAGASSLSCMSVLSWCWSLDWLAASTNISSAQYWQRRIDR